MTRKNDASRVNQQKNSLKHKSELLALTARGKTKERIDRKLIEQMESQERN
jgi:hypothetical protein